MQRGRRVVLQQSPFRFLPEIDTTLAAIAFGAAESSSLKAVRG